jgi:hypothetical protein
MAGGGSSICFNLSESESHTVLLRIVSNHGHESLVSLSEIDIISPAKHSLAICKIEVVGEFRHNPTLARLIDREFIKKEDDQLWMHPWPPEPPANTVDLLMTLEGCGPIECVRIWPDSVDATRSAKGIQIFLDDTQVYHGDLEGSFGSMIPISDPGGSTLSAEMKQVLETSQRRHEKRIRDDQGGVFPLLEFTQLEFQLLATNSNRHIFGLSMIRLYDVDGQLMTIDPERSVFDVRNCGQHSELSKLFLKRSGELRDDFVPWKGTVIEGIPTIVARFEEPIKVIAIEVVNADLAHTDEDISVERMHILADTRSLWVGKLNRRTPSSEGPKPNSTFVFTVCSAEIKRLVIGDR